MRILDFQGKDDFLIEYEKKRQALHVNMCKTHWLTIKNVFPFYFYKSISVVSSLFVEKSWEREVQE